MVTLACGHRIDEVIGHSRPCAFASCRWHLYLDLDRDRRSIKFNFPDIEPDEMVHSCALDLADRNGMSLEEVGEAMNITRERIRQIEVRALGKLKSEPLLRKFAEPGGDRVKGQRRAERGGRQPVPEETDTDDMTAGEFDDSLLLGWLDADEDQLDAAVQALPQPEPEPFPCALRFLDEVAGNEAAGEPKPPAVEATVKATIGSVGAVRAVETVEQLNELLGPGCELDPLRNAAKTLIENTGPVAFLQVGEPTQDEAEPEPDPDNTTQAPPWPGMEEIMPEGRDIINQAIETLPRIEPESEAATVIVALTQRCIYLELRLASWLSADKPPEGTTEDPAAEPEATPRRRASKGGRKPRAARRAAKRAVRRPKATRLPAIRASGGAKGKQLALLQEICKGPGGRASDYAMAVYGSAEACKVACVYQMSIVLKRRGLIVIKDRKYAPTATGKATA